MYNFWKNNKNVILIAVAMFVVSITVLLFLLTEEHTQTNNLTANVMQSAKTAGHEKSEQEYRNKFASNNEPFIVLGLDGKIDFASWDYREFSGYSDEELTDQMIFTLVDPADLPMLVASFGEVVATQDAKSMVGPYKIKNKDGEYRTHIASLYPILEDDKVVGVIFNPKDITDAISPVEEIDSNQQTTTDTTDNNNMTPNEQDTEGGAEQKIYYGPKIGEMDFEGVDYYSQESTSDSEKSVTENDAFNEGNTPESEEETPVSEPEIIQKPQASQAGENKEVKSENKAKSGYDSVNKEKVDKGSYEEKNEKPDNEQKPANDSKDDKGKMIRNTKDKDENRLVVNKLAKVFNNRDLIDIVMPQTPTLYYWYPYLTF